MQRSFGLVPAALVEGQVGELDEALDAEAAKEQIVETLVSAYEGFLGHLPLLVGGLLVLLLSALLAIVGRSLSTRLLGRTRLSRSLRELFSRLIFLLIWVAGLLVAAMVVFPGLTPTKALGGLGVASVAVGFAFKDIFENFFAGVLILWRFPFDVEDVIECEDILGTVEEITIRNSLIRVPSGELVIVPNSKLFTNPVRVLTDRDSRRTSLISGIAYGESVAKAVDVIEEAVRGCATVDADPAPEICPAGFGSSSVDIEVLWWTRPRPIQVRESRAEVVVAIKEGLDAAGIEIPFPYRTLTFKDPLRVESRGDERGQDAEDGDGG